VVGILDDLPTDRQMIDNGVLVRSKATRC